MVKLYLRYSLGATFGVIGSSNCNVVYDANGNQCFTGALEQVNVWNLRQQSLACRMAEPFQPTKPQSEVVVLERSPNGTHLAAGYADGVVRLWNLRDRTCSAKLVGHRGAVSALSFNASGNLLASGSRDTDVIVWDVLQESGLYRLRGHTDEVTGVRMLNKSRRIISSSKDSFLKVWDLDSQHCIQTLVGNRAEVWAFDVDPTETRLVVSASDQRLRVWDMPAAAEEEQLSGSAAPAASADGFPELKEAGYVLRQGRDRVMTIRFNPSGTLLGCQAADRTVQMFRVNSPKQIRKKQKKRLAKQQERAGGDGAAVTESTAEPVSDALSSLQALRTGAKIRSFAFAPREDKVLLLLSNNTLELHHFDASEKKRIEFQKATAVSAPGHRSDIRAVAISSDDSLLASVSAEEVKVWNARTQACVRTMQSPGYGLCVLLLPGNRHLLLGTKEGGLYLFDVMSGECLCESAAAHAGAVWSIALLPGLKGFVSGAGDKSLKFWDFDLVSAPAADGASQTPKQLTFVEAKTVQMTEDVLQVKFSKNGKFLAISLLDSTVKVLFADTLKFFLSLFGHKLPVMGLDISSDSTLLVTGSADKNLKIWGLDFGDCRKSLYAHQAPVMQVAFVPETHYLFSVSKDHTLRYWDIDKHECLLTLQAHFGEVWALAVSRDGDFALTGSHDRSLRLWNRTDQQFSLEEARDDQEERQLDAAVDQQGNRLPPVLPGAPEALESAPAAKRTAETMKAGERLMEALELASTELANQQQYARDLVVARKKGAKAELPVPPAPSLYLQGKSPTDYLLHVLRAIRANDLELSWCCHSPASPSCSRFWTSTFARGAPTLS
jgi:U3 small nucleolar RNA-associated protein 12